MVCRENHLPYDRPKLSKAMNITVDKIELRPAQFFVDHGIDLLRGVECTELDAIAKKVTLSDGQVIQYDQCLVATGGDPRTIPCPGSDSTNIHLLRNIEASNTIYAEATGKKVVIIGSSFIGMETASALAATASSVTVIGMEKVPFERVLGHQLGEVIQGVRTHPFSRLTSVFRTQQG